LLVPPGGDWGLVAVLGLSSGYGELLLRYKTAPVREFLSRPALGYVAMHLTASLVAFWLIRFLQWPIVGTGWDIIAAGLGAMAIIRTEFAFSAGDRQLRMEGPGKWVQVGLLPRVDRAFRAKVADARADNATRLVGGLPHPRTIEQLAEYCQLIAPLPIAEDTDFRKKLQALRRAPSSDHLKELGIVLLVIDTFGLSVAERASGLLSLSWEEAQSQRRE
jgi:hypothetical protein